MFIIGHKYAKHFKKENTFNLLRLTKTLLNDPRSILEHLKQLKPVDYFRRKTSLLLSSFLLGDRFSKKHCLVGMSNPPLAGGGVIRT